MSGIVEHEVEVYCCDPPWNDCHWICRTVGCPLPNGRGGFRTEDAARIDAQSHVTSMLGQP